MKILHIQRKPISTQFSVEGYFSRVRESIAALSASPASMEPLVSEESEHPFNQNFETELFVLPCYSRGLWRRVVNVFSVLRPYADVYHVTGDVHFVTMLLPRRRTVLTVLDCQVLDRLKGWRRFLVKWNWFSMPVRRASCITVISQATKERLLREVPIDPERVHVIPVSVSPQYKPFPKRFNAKRPCILQVGTKANKNVFRLVEALRGIPCWLDIIGPIDEALERHLAVNRIEYRACVGLSEAAMVERYQQADIVSFVSTHEGFGMPIVEAQQVERVCVTSNCSSMPEVAGAGACFVDPYDVASIRDGILRVIEDDVYREQLLAAGRRNRERFDPRTIAAAFCALYAQLATR